MTATVRWVATAALAGVVLVLGLRAEARPRDEWQWNADVQLGYNDNVFLYSDRDIGAFHAGASPERFGFESIGDFFLSPELSAEKPIRRSAKSRTDLEADLRARVYMRDSEADDIRLRVGLQHLFDQQHWVRARVTYLPDYFVRRLYDQEGAAFASAEFDYSSVDVKYWQRFSEQLAGDIGLTWERRDYNAAFSERDASDLTVSAQAKYSPSKRWDTWLDLGVGRSDARATDGLPGVDPDVSYDEVSWVAGVRYRPSKRDVWEAEWEPSNQRYTTHLTPDQDPFHSGREDRENAFRLQVRRNLGQGRALSAEWEHARSRSHLPALPTGAVRDESLSYDRNLVQVTYSAEF